MDDQLLAYLLNVLEGAELAQVESLLASDTGVRHRLAALQRLLTPLWADSDAPAPPPGLAQRTLEKLAEVSPPTLPNPSINGVRRFPGQSSRWRRADILVAATLMLSVLGLGFPWVYSQRMHNECLAGVAQIVECKDNLRQLHVALQTSDDRKTQGYPGVPGAKPPRHVTGQLVNLTRESCVPVDASVSRCPAVAAPPPSVKPIPVKDVLAMDESEYKAYLAGLSGRYVMLPGFYDEDGKAGWNKDKKKPYGYLPIIADAPPADGGNSPNHGGKGQNVLFKDGHVKFYADRKAGGDQEDIYQKMKLVAPALAEDEAVQGNR